MVIFDPSSDLVVNDIISPAENSADKYAPIDFSSSPASDVDSFL